MNASASNTAIQLLAYGAALAFIKIIYLFFDPYNVGDFVVFLAAGIVLGRKVPASRLFLGLLLPLPAVAICLLIVMNLGYSNIVRGVGTSYAISLLVIPVAFMIGIFIHRKFVGKESARKI